MYVYRYRWTLDDNDHFPWQALMDFSSKHTEHQVNAYYVFAIMCLFLVAIAPITFRAEPYYTREACMRARARSRMYSDLSERRTGFMATLYIT